MSLSHLLPVALLALCAMAVAMATAWLVQRKTGATGWVDVIWTSSTGLVALVLSLLPLADTSLVWRQAGVAAAAALWALRLGAHLFARTRKHGDDLRYRALLNEWGMQAQRRMFWQLQAQAAVGALLALSAALAAHLPARELQLQDLLGLAIAGCALLGETTADRQLRRAPRGAVCATGWWAWSRHPNYFFEWLYWASFPVIAIGYPGGWLAIAAPLVMYWALVYVSGIPPLEAHMIRSRGAAYVHYQASTSPFFPLPPGLYRRKMPAVNS